MDNEFNCRFYFGNRINATSTIQKIDYSAFKLKPEELKRYSLVGNFYYLAGSLKLLKKTTNFYLITGEPYCVSSWLLLLAGKLLGKKIFIWGHGLYGNEKGLTLTIKKQFNKLASGIFVYGNRSKELLINSGISGVKIDVIYNSLDYEKQLLIRKNLQLSDIYHKHFENASPTLLFIGRLEKNKQLRMLIFLVGKLNASGFPVNAIFIGDGNDKDKLTQITKDHQLEDKIWFYGSCYNEDTIGHLIFNSDICISPGNVGLTAIHSLSFGTPVITHNNFCRQMPEFEAIKEGLTGDFFAEGNLDALVKTTKKWLSKYPKKTEKLIKDCYDIIDKYYNPYYQISILKKRFNQSESITN